MIGKNVTISNSFIWGDVTIEDGSTITNAIVCDRAVIKRNTVISDGCVISFGVVVGPDITLPAETKVTLDFVSTFFDLKKAQEVSPCSEIDLGSQGKGFRWKIDEDSDPTNSLGLSPLSP